MDDDHDVSLPASVEAAWGLRERPHKGPKPGLSLERIVDAAVKLAVSEGLAAVSMSRVATELGSSAMSLYRYVGSKKEVLSLMTDAAYRTLPVPRSADEGWRGGLSRWAWAERAVLRQHPWVLRIPISEPPTTPNKVAWFELGLQCMHETGLAEGEKASVLLLVSGFVRNEATLSGDVAAAFHASGATSQEVLSTYSRILARLIDAERFPALSAVIAAGVFDEPDDPDAEFIFGLERLLDGIEALVSARAGNTP